MKKIKVFILLFLVCYLSCKTDKEENAKNINYEIAFDKKKWETKDGADYLYREKMLNDIVYNDTVRTLNKEEILSLLGEPDRSNENYLYYMITQKRLGFWPLHTKSLVIKFSENYTIEWIKIHE